MSSVYGEPADVLARPDGRPLRFVWRSRLFVVRAILEHWVINQEWWRDPTAERGQPELEFWRIEAFPGQGVPVQVYELRRDPVAGTWTIRPNLGGTQAGRATREGITSPCRHSVTPRNRQPPRNRSPRGTGSPPRNRRDVATSRL